MKRYSQWGLAVVVTLGVISVWSIDVEGRPGGPKSEGIRAELNLSDEQKAQLQALRQEVRAELDGIRAQVKAGDLSREEARRSRRELLESRHDERQAIFTPTQLEQLQQFRAERAESGRTRHRRRAGGHLLEQLELSADQQQSLDALRLQHRATASELRESGEGSRDSFKALREQHHSEVKAILTETQLEQLELLRAERRAQFEDEGRRRHARRRWRRHRGHDVPPAEAAGDTPTTVTDAAATGTPATAVEAASWGALKQKTSDATD